MLGPWPGKAHGGTHPAEPLSRHLRGRSDTQERGGAEKRRNQREETKAANLERQEDGPVPARHTAESRSRNCWGPLSPRGHGSGREVWQRGTSGGGEKLFTLALPRFSLGPSSCSQK